MATPRYWMGMPPDYNMRVPKSVRNCTMFIGVRILPDEIVYGGTAFLVSIPLGNAPEKVWTYLVTAKHCIEDIAKKHNGRYVIRANREDGSAAVFEAAPDFRWWEHPDDQVDAVVAEFNPSSEIWKQLDYSAVPLSDFLSAEIRGNHHIGEGDEVLITGLFKQAAGRERNLPIVRSGVVAMMQDEKISHERYGPIDAHLIEVRSIGGLSGSPVFVTETIFVPLKVKSGREVRCTIPGRTFFMGSMIGHWDLPIGYDENLKKQYVNMGISMVTPATKIAEILMRQELVAMRKEAEEEYLKSGGPTLDSGFEKPQTPQEQFTKQDFESALKKASRKIE